ncbi:unnamed protein product [Schistosoma turkestanicum]|nr:unnamed protein product [Schistosoma turkestanicum]
MYGLLFESLRKFIQTTYDDEIWSQILYNVIGTEKIFQTNQTYQEDLYDKLMQNLSKLIHLSLNDLYTENGKYFIQFLIDSGFSSVLKVMGVDFVDFLTNVDEIHKQIKRIYPFIRPPSFTVTKIENDHMIHLLYCTKRKGFTYFVQGQLINVAKLIYNLDVQVELISQEKKNLLTLSLFSSSSSPSPSPSSTSSSSLFIESYFRIYCFNGRLQMKEFRPNIKSLCLSNDIIQSSINSNELHSLLPFYVVINQNLMIMKVGEAVARICDNLVGCSFTELFLIRHPVINCTFEQIKLHMHNTFELVLMKNLGVNKNSDHLLSDKAVCKFRGEMRFVEEWNMLLFLGAPSIRDIRHLSEHGLYICDLNMFDRSRDVIICGDRISDELVKLFQMQRKKSEALERNMKHLDKMRKLTDRLLYQCIPRAVARKLRDGTPAIETIEAYDSVSICFTKVFNFSAKCMHTSVNQIVELLNKMYTLFDDLTEASNVYKVETIGDSYMLVSGAPHKTRFHSAHITEMALNILEVTHASLAWPKSNVSNDTDDDGNEEEKEVLKLFIGCHTGPIVAGIVGHKTPRYCLFGDTVNTASRMMSSGVPDRIHVSQTFAVSLSEFPYTLEYRGEINVKGKGKMKTYFVNGRSNEFTLPNNFYENQLNFGEILEKDVVKIETDDSTVSYNTSVGEIDEFIEKDHEISSESSTGIDIEEVLGHTDKQNSECTTISNDHHNNNNTIKNKLKNAVVTVNYNNNNNNQMIIPRIHKENELVYNDASSINQIDKHHDQPITTSSTYDINDSNSVISFNYICPNFKIPEMTPNSQKSQEKLSIDNVLNEANQRLFHYQHESQKIHELPSCSTTYKKDVKFVLNNKEDDNQLYVKFNSSDVDGGEDRERRISRANVLDEISFVKECLNKHQQSQKHLSTNPKNITSVEQKHKIEKFRRMIKNHSFGQKNPISLCSSGSDVFNRLYEPLTLGLTELAIVKPDEPIKYLGSWLKRYKSMEHQEDY